MSIHSAEKAEGHPMKDVRGRDFGFLPIPRRLRYQAEAPPHFGFVLLGVFALASTFIVANVYYSQPLLIEMSLSFGVSYQKVSQIPTLTQAGYAVGLLLISPLGDLLRPRPLILALVTLSSAVALSLALIPILPAFLALSFLFGTVSVTPQILLPLAADLSPPHRRGTAIATCISGLLLGVLVARVLAGALAAHAPWSTAYAVAAGAQAAVLVAMYFLLPDYPARAPHMSYAGVLGSMARYCVTEPLLVQAALVNFAGVACFANFWVTLTFLLGEPPYHYSTLEIGMFGLVGMVGVLLGPFVGVAVDRLVPWYAALAGTLGYAASQALQTSAGGVHVAAIVVACIGLDVFRQAQQVSLTSAVIALEPAARSRLNAVVIVAVFLGQVMGTTVGTQVFVKYGWRAAAGLSLAWMGFQIAVLLLRGPHCARHTWFGYEGGLEPRKDVAERRARVGAESEADALVRGMSVDGKPELTLGLTLVPSKDGSTNV